MRAMQTQRWRDFVGSRVAPIPGWLQPEAALLTAHLGAAQRACGLRGPALEIGVFKGKYLALLYELSREDEPVVGVDLFIGAEDKAAVAESVRANIAAACGEASRLRLLVADTMDLTAAQLREAGGAEAFRMISIDAGHTRELVLHDMEVAGPLLQPGGIMALDDFYNHTTPGVTEGISEYFFRARPRLAPFAHCYNKLFATTPEYHARYLAETWRFAEEADWLAASQRTLARRRENQAVGFAPILFGYEIAPFL